MPIGAVLAGGASRRMGRDKATISLDGERLVDGTVRRLAPLCDVVVVADRGRGLVPEIPSVPDGPGRGPAAGILGVAARHPERELLVLACDLPEVPGSLLAALVALPGDLVLPRTDRGVEPLCALYRPAALDVLHERVELGELSLHPLAGSTRLQVTTLQGPDLLVHGDPEQIFRNLNRPQHL